MRTLKVVALCTGCLLSRPAVAEMAPAASYPCFPGSIYRKAVSSQDEWTGIEAVVTLPEFSPDPGRSNPKNGQPLDNPSIYLGARAGEREIDAGVNWEVVKEPGGAISRERKAYRPFWRNDRWSSGPARPDFYYYPGDRLRIRVETTEEGKMQLCIELLERGVKGKEAEALAGRREPSAHAEWSSVPADAQTSLTVNFDGQGFGPGRLQEWKRVTAIDQFGNEGKPAMATRARLGETTWHEVWLLRGKSRVPMNPARFTDMRCPAPEQISAELLGESGERLTINERP